MSEVKSNGSEAVTQLQNELTLDSINSLTEIWDGFVLMDKYGIPKDNCQSLDDIKERITLHYQKIFGQGKSIDAAEETIAKLKAEDELKRHELRQIFHETLQALKHLDRQILGHLKAEHLVKEDIATEFQKHVNNLSSSACPILVAGETSAGKSSLLNLLLGKEILPQRLLSCTSVICKIRYGPAPVIKITHEDGLMEEKILDMGKNPMDQVAKYIFKETGRESSLPYDSVDIYLPLPLLKTGVYIIDSPGIGENAAMDKMFLDFVTQEDIFAFIYVIKSDNAGGVHEDRLQRILQHVLEKQRLNMGGNFNPRAAIFVCNRWDLVPQSENTLVFEDTFSKLSRSWPDLQRSQLFCLSATKAWRTSAAGYVSDDYSQLLDGIQRLIPIGLHHKLHMSYGWLDHFLSRVQHHCHGYTANSKLSKSELQARHMAAELRLHKVEKEADLIMKKLEIRLSKGIELVTEKLSDYLKSEIARVAMSLWVDDELPTVTEDDIWPEIEAQIDCKIEKKLTDILYLWNEQHHVFQNVQDELLLAFKEEFLLLESQINAIEQCLQGENNGFTDPDKTEEQIRHQFNMKEHINSSGPFGNFNFNSLHRLFLGVAAPVLVPVAIGILIGAPILLLWDIKKWRRRSMEQKNLDKYLEDPIGFIQQRGLVTMEKIAHKDAVRGYVEVQVEGTRNFLLAIKEAIPNLVQSNQILLDEIIKDKGNYKELEENLKIMERMVPFLQENLASYGNLHLRNFDFHANQIQYRSSSTDSFRNMSGKMSQIWTEVKQGKLKMNGKDVNVSVKLYTKDVSALHLILEEIHLRKVKHPHIADLLGTFEAKKGIPGFVIQSHLVKARSQLFGYKALPQRSKTRVLGERCRRFLEQVSIGLEYMHAKNLVHMELSLDSVMILPNEDHAKLINLGESRYANLPSDLDTPASAYVYLPPEVLCGDKYKCKADIYSLGLMAWELWNQEEVFKSKRKNSFKDFAQNIQTIKLLGDNLNPFKDLIELSTVPVADERIEITAWVNHIRKIMLVLGDQED